MEIEYLKFAIGDRAACVWGHNVSALNARFLDGVDPSFLLYEAQIHRAALRNASGDEGHKIRTHAAISLRLAYGIALESLFAFLAATAQAPHCMFGWLSSYQPRELRTLVTRIIRGEAVRALRPLGPMSWERLAAELLRPLEAKDLKCYERQVALFSRAWKILASDFVNDLRTKEYNSLKHGVRTQPGAFQIDMRTPEGESLLQSSTPYGHAFALLQPKPERRWHHDVKFAAVTLEPEKCQAALAIISFSIHNAIAFARAKTVQDSKTAHIKVPDTDALFDALETHTSPISSISYGGTVSIDDESKYLSREAILAVYENEDAPTLGLP